MMTSIRVDKSAPLLEVVVTARPSWARVKHLVSHYYSIAGKEKVHVTLLGPAVSTRYGNVKSGLPEGLSVDLIPTLGDSDSLGSIALSCVNGSTSLIHKWSINRPDCVLVIADRTETLGVSLASALMQIPLIHLQGGEVSGSIDDKVRDANTKLADLHLTTNSQTASRLESMGEDLLRIKIVGCPSIDVVTEVEQSPLLFNFENSSDLGGVGANFSLDQHYGLIMYHPDTINNTENIDWARLLLELTSKNTMNWIWFWPNPDHGSHVISHEIRKSRELRNMNNVRFLVNLEPEVFVKLAHNSRVLIGNSSFGIREASYMGLPVVNLGMRQFGRQRAENVLDIPIRPDVNDFVNQVQKQVQRNRFNRSEIYGRGDSGLRAASAIANWVPSLKSS